MREIKFRAWNGKKPEMIYLGDLTTVNWDIKFIFKHYKATQWTGLTDRNGVEIYEGDILRLGKARETFVPLAPAKTILTVAYRYGGFNTEEGGIGEICDWHLCEVIGNIWENPELLKKEVEDE